MEQNNNQIGPSMASTDVPKERRSVHVQAIVNWMVAANGYHLPAPGEPDKAIDSLMNDIQKLSLDNLKASIPADVKAQVPDIDQLTEDALKSIMIDAAKLTMTEKPPVSGPHQWDTLPSRFEETQRCWTNGTSVCSCRVPGRLAHGLLEDDGGADFLCGLDCPVGCSQAEIAAQKTEEYSPWCGNPDCVCQSEEDHFWRVCVLCGQATCVCVPGTVVHEYDPFCMRGDCTCLNQLPSGEGIISATLAAKK